MSVPLLEAQDLALRVGGRTLASAMNFRLHAGEVWCLLGPNGSGKSTFLHTAVGLLAPQGGVLRLAGRALGDWSAEGAARQRGFLPQNFHDAFSASVEECVLLGRHPYLSRWQWEGEDERELASAALRAVDLAGFEQRDVLTLSGASASARPWRRCLSRMRRCCCWTNRCRIWTCITSCWCWSTWSNWRASAAKG